MGSWCGHGGPDLNHGVGAAMGSWCGHGDPDSNHGAAAHHGGPDSDPGGPDSDHGAAAPTGFSAHGEHGVSETAIRSMHLCD
jgi:hypothetical protein